MLKEPLMESKPMLVSSNVSLSMLPLEFLLLNVVQNFLTYYNNFFKKEAKPRQSVAGFFFFVIVVIDKFNFLFFLNFPVQYIISPLPVISL